MAYLALSGLHALFSIPYYREIASKTLCDIILRVSRTELFPEECRSVTASEDRLSARDNSQTIIKHTFGSSSRSSRLTTLTRSFQRTGRTIGQLGQIHGDLLTC